jgi:hypothetical protein
VFWFQNSALDFYPCFFHIVTISRAILSRNSKAE